jgi:hypothetical protein
VSIVRPRPQMMRHCESLYTNQASLPYPLSSSFEFGLFGVTI